MKSQFLLWALFLVLTLSCCTKRENFLESEIGQENGLPVMQGTSSEDDLAIAKVFDGVAYPLLTQAELLALFVPIDPKAMSYVGFVYIDGTHYLCGRNAEHSLYLILEFLPNTDRLIATGGYRECTGSTCTRCDFVGSTSCACEGSGADDCQYSEGVVSIR